MAQSGRDNGSVSDRDQQAVSIDLGQVSCSYQKMGFSFHVEEDGIAYVQIIARSDFEDDDESDQFVMMRLDDERYEQFMRAVNAVQSAVTKYRNAGPERRLTESYRRRDLR